MEYFAKNERRKTVTQVGSLENSISQENKSREIIKDLREEEE